MAKREKAYSSSRQIPPSRKVRFPKTHHAALGASVSQDHAINLYFDVTARWKNVNAVEWICMQECRQQFALAKTVKRPKVAKIYLLGGRQPR
jgi:hypothetical protein